MTNIECSKFDRKVILKDNLDSIIESIDNRKIKYIQFFF